MHEVITKSVVEAIVGVLKSKLSRRVDRNDINARIDRHLVEAAAWSSRVQFYGMSSAQDTDVSTISLRFTGEPRRFFTIQSTGPATENVLLATPGHFLVIGNVGAGKTTTLKRITQTLLTSDSVSVQDTFQCPVVVIGRNLRDDAASLTCHIADMLAIPWESAAETDELGAEKREPYRCGEEPLSHVVARILNEARCVLIVDGLDEVPAGARSALYGELESLGRSLHDAKIVASVRSGDYTSLLEGFGVVEVCALSRTEILDIARAWLPEKHGEFIKHLDALPYADIIDRPLLLTQLLFLFRRYGELPEQPSEVYRSVVELFLREWDAERRIVRRSRYAQFDARRKATFLAAVAYELTYRVKVKQFSTAELRRVYASICDRFGLPPEDMVDVVAELETHTGLIGQAGPTTYEFSHLSLQEYLCADYLVRDQFAANFISYLREYPSPVAVAVTLSSNPSSWFAAVVLRYSHVISRENIYSFLSRLFLERPLFAVDEGLGVAVMKLYHVTIGDARSYQLLNRFMKMRPVRDSVRKALLLFRFLTEEELETAGELVVLSRAPSVSCGGVVPVPDEVALPLSTLRSLKKR